MSTNQPNNNQGYNSYFNEGADFWRFIIGVNVFPADSRNKVTYEHWHKNGWQTNPIPPEQHEFWKKEKAFEKGLMVMPGKPLHKPEKASFYLVCIDWDKERGLKELFPDKSLDEVRRGHFVEQHLDDLSRGHLWFYSPIAFPKKNADDVLGLEVKGLASHGVMIVSPSIHKNGHHIEVTGCWEPKTLTKEVAFEFLLHIDKICKKHNVPYLDKNGNASAAASSLSSNMKNMIKNLAIDSRIKIHNGTRHDTLISIANSILFRYSKIKNHEKLEAFFMEINDNLCIPEPLPEKEISQIWTDALEFVSRVREQEQQEEQEQCGSNKQTILESIPNETIRSMLGSDIWTLISENPLKFIVARRKACYICRASITYTDVGANPPVKKAHLNYGAILIRLCPKRVILHENPLKFLESSPQYTIVFEDHRAQNIVISGTIDGIISKLKEMPGYVVSSYGITEALTAIIGAFSDDIMLEIDRTVDFEGYYYHGGDIQISRIILDEKHPRRTKEEVVKCIEYLEKRSRFQIWEYKGRTIDRRDLLASAIKWTIPAPFNFLLKQQNCKPYLKGFDMTGERDGGKSGLSGEMLNVHGNPTNEQDADSIYSKSAGSANTEAKFAKALGSTTYPIELSEFGRLEAYGRREDLVESCKTAIDGLIVRRGKKDSRTDAPFPSLSPMIVNGNSIFTSKGELLKRFHVAKFSEEDRHDRDPNSPFNKFQIENKHLLKVLGDWTIRYILDNKQELLLSRKYSPYPIGEIALRAFYKFADLEVPEWLGWRIVDTSLEELDQDIEGIIRSILYNHVHKTLRENSNLIQTKDLGNITMFDRIRVCLEADVWPWIRQIRGSELKYYINNSVLELFSYRLPDLTLKKLAEKTGFEYITAEGRKKLLCTKKQPRIHNN